MAKVTEDGVLGFLDDVVSAVEGFASGARISFLFVETADSRSCNFCSEPTTYRLQCKRTNNAVSVTVLCPSCKDGIASAPEA